jgi:hypothetical protein
LNVRSVWFYMLLGDSIYDMGETLENY